jgi:leader peptidase (prepilin peptidase)/N-methyltransferase
MSSWDLASIYCPWFPPAVAFILGLCVGSFLNVCVYRMPRGLSVVWPPSFCPKSNTPLRWFENIPVLSFIFLRGRGRISHEPIGWQYPAVELLTAGAFLCLWLSFPHPVAIACMIMSAIFIAGAFIDWQFKIIPDSLTIGGALVGLTASVIVPALHGASAQVAGGIGSAWTLPSALGSLGISLQGMLIGSAVILWMAILGELAFRREAMGFGDVKLLGMIGAFIGWQGAVFSIFAGAFIGVFAAAATMIAEKLSGRGGKFFGREIPFGPMLCAAAFAYLWMKPVVLNHWELFMRAIRA